MSIMNIKPITQKQAQKLWRLGVHLYRRYHWRGGTWETVNYSYGSPLRQARAALYDRMQFGVEVE